MAATYLETPSVTCTSSFLGNQLQDKQATSPLSFSAINPSDNSLWITKLSIHNFSGKSYIFYEVTVLLWKTETKSNLCEMG